MMPPPPFSPSPFSAPLTSHYLTYSRSTALKYFSDLDSDGWWRTVNTMTGEEMWHRKEDTNTSTMNERQAKQLRRMLDLAIGGPLDVFQQPPSSPKGADRPRSFKASLMSLFDEPLPAFQINAAPTTVFPDEDSAAVAPPPSSPNIFHASFFAPPPSSSPSLASASSGGSISTPSKVVRVAIPSFASPLTHPFGERTSSSTTSPTSPTSPSLSPLDTSAAVVASLDQQQGAPLPPSSCNNNNNNNNNSSVTSSSARKPPHYYPPTPDAMPKNGASPYRFGRGVSDTLITVPSREDLAAMMPEHEDGGSLLDDKKHPSPLLSPENKSASSTVVVPTTAPPSSPPRPARVSTSRCYVGPVLSNPLVEIPTDGIQLLSREMIRAYFISYVWMYIVDQVPYQVGGGAAQQQQQQASSSESTPPSPPSPPSQTPAAVGEPSAAPPPPPDASAAEGAADTPHLPFDAQLMKECLSEVLGRYPVLACRLSTAPSSSSTTIILDSCNPKVLGEGPPSKAGYGVTFDTVHVLDHPSLTTSATTVVDPEHLCSSLANSDAETAKLVHKPPNASVLAGEECMACFKVTLFYSSKSPTFKGQGENRSGGSPEEEWGAPLAATVGVSMFHPIVDGSSLHRFINEWSDLCRIRGIWKAQKEAETKRRAARSQKSSSPAAADAGGRHFFDGIDEDADEDEFPELIIDPPPPSQFDRFGVFDPVPQNLPRSELESICSKAGIHISTPSETRLLLKCRELVDEKGLSMCVDFTSDELTHMRVHAEKTSRTWISRHEALAAHLSRVLLKLWVSSTKDGDEEASLDTKVSISSTANGRGRPNSNIPSLFFGNAACYTSGSCITPRQCRDQSFGEIAQVWHDDLLSVSGEGTAVKNALWSQDVAIEYGLTKSFTYMGNPVAPAMVVNNRSKFPAFDIDFGWGAGNGTPFDVLPHHGAPGIKVYASKEGGARVYFKGSSDVLPLMKEFVKKEVAAGGSISCDIASAAYGGFWLFSPPVEILQQQQWESYLRMFKHRVPDEDC